MLFMNRHDWRNLSIYVCGQWKSRIHRLITNGGRSNRHTMVNKFSFSKGYNKDWTIRTWSDEYMQGIENERERTLLYVVLPPTAARRNSLSIIIPHPAVDVNANMQSLQWYETMFFFSFQLLFNYNIIIIQQQQKNNDMQSLVRSAA